MRTTAIPYKPWSFAVLFGNYTRLGVTFALGVLGLRMASDLGPQTLAAVLLVLGMRWIFAVLPAAVEAALVPFVGRISNAIVQQKIYRVLVLGLFAVLGLWLIRGAFDFGGLPGDALHWPFVWIALHLTLHMTMAPHMAQLIATGQMARLNIWVIARRVLDTASLFLVWCFEAGGADQVFFIGTVLSGFALALWLVFPTTNFSASTGEATAADLGQGIKATVQQGAGTALLLRGSVIVVNVIAGVEATLLFGVTFALLGYVRQATTGLVIGLDGRAARNSSGHLMNITQRATWIQSVCVTFGVLMVLLFSHPLIKSLLPTIGDFQKQQIVGLLKIMILGTAFRAIGDCWIKILNGAGHAPRFGTAMCIGAVVYLAALAAALGLGQSYSAAAWLYCIVQAVLFLGLLPRKLSQVIEIPMWRLLVPIGVTLGPVALWVLSRS